MVVHSLDMCMHPTCMLCMSRQGACVLVHVALLCCCPTCVCFFRGQKRPFAAFAAECQAAISFTPGLKAQIFARLHSVSHNNPAMCLAAAALPRYHGKQSLGKAACVLSVVCV